jgi:putative sporulation protein YtxC
LVEIFFKNKRDAKKFYHYFQLQLNPIHSEKNILLSEDEHIAKVEIFRENEHILSAARKAFHHSIIQIKLNDWFRMILREHYFYEDEDEQQQILDIIQSILEGKRVDLASIIDDLNISCQLEKEIEQIFENHHSFSFDSFVKFRMRPFMERLQKYVEVSIDEYKMEQEYQMFIQTLREFLTEREAKLQHLHLLLNEETMFFDEQFCEIKRGELVRMIDRRLLFNHPVYVDSVTIAPLLSIAPFTIYLYTDDCEQPLIRTIRNIFEERVIIQPVESFYKRKNEFQFITDGKRD